MNRESIQAVIDNHDRDFHEGCNCVDRIEELLDSDLWVLIVGNPFDGLRVFGPFDSTDEIDGYTEEHHAHDEWWVVKLTKEGAPA